MKLPLPDKQLVVMCDASEHATGYVLLIEDYSEPQSGSLKKYALDASGSKKFQGGQISLTMYGEYFVAMHSAFDKFGRILWGAKKPIIVMTDNKALTRFVQAKHIPPSLWNFCDQTVQFNFIMAQVPLFQCWVTPPHKQKEKCISRRKLTVVAPYCHNSLSCVSRSYSSEWSSRNCPTKRK